MTKLNLEEIDNANVWVISSDEYDVLIENFKNNYEPQDYFPTPKDFENFEREPLKFVEMLLFLSITNPKPQDNTEEYSKKNILNFLSKHLEIEDELDENCQDIKSLFKQVS